MSIKDRIDGALGWARVQMRERKERAAERKAAQAGSNHHDSRFWLLSVPAMATILAGIVEWYWAILFCIEATGKLDWNWETAAGNTGIEAVNQWDFAFSAHIPVLVGLMCATAPIIMWSMVWLPVQFKAAGSGAVRRGSMIATGILANILVIVSGTVVMNYNRQEQVRADLVMEQSADAGRNAIGARLQVAQTELARITAEGNTSNEARAARAGVAGWRTYVREAQGDPSVPAADRQRIARAMGSAEAADALRARIEDLTVQQATAAPAAATAANVQDDVGQGLNTFAQYAEVYRPPFVALLCTLVGIFGVWWWIALQERIDKPAAGAWADGDDMLIPDLRAAEPLETEPMVEAKKQAMFDGETGAELVEANYPKYRKKATRKALTEIDKLRREREKLAKRMNRASVIELDSLRAKDAELLDQIAALQREAEEAPDETGAPDGGARAGSVVAEGVVAPVVDEPRGEPAGANADEQQHEEAVPEIDQTTLPELTPEQELALFQADEPVSDSADATIEQSGQEQAESETALETQAAVTDEDGAIGLGADGRDGVLQGEHDHHVRSRELELAK